MPDNRDDFDFEEFIERWRLPLPKMSAKDIMEALDRLETEYGDNAINRFLEPSRL